MARAALAAIRSWRSGPGGTWVERAPDRRVAGFAMVLWLDQVSPAAARADPGVRPTYGFAARGALGSRCWYTRVWMGADTHQDPSPAVTANGYLALHPMLTSRPASMTFYAKHVDAIAAGLPADIYERVPEADFEVDGSRYGIQALLAHDFRGDSHRVWWRRYALALAGAPAPGGAPASSAPSPESPAGTCAASTPASPTMTAPRWPKSTSCERRGTGFVPGTPLRLCDSWFLWS